ncbi:MAG: tetratricopeptide repeat protein [Rhodanobacter sp.]
MSKAVDASSTIYFNAVERFVSGDYALCIDDFLRLSSEEDARATLYAATIFDRGGGGVDHDWERARALYKQSLAQSYLPGAALGLAFMFYKGRGGTQDFSEAAKYFGMLRDNAFSQIMLGVMSLKGKGRLPSEEDALHYFDKAWILGHPLGLKNAAIIRFHRGQYMRAVYDFLRSAYLIFLNYGVKRLPLVKSPHDCEQKLC